MPTSTRNVPVLTSPYLGPLVKIAKGQRVDFSVPKAMFDGRQYFLPGGGLQNPPTSLHSFSWALYKQVGGTWTVVLGSLYTSSQFIHELPATSEYFKGWYDFSAASLTNGNYSIRMRFMGSYEGLYYEDPNGNGNQVTQEYIEFTWSANFQIDSNSIIKPNANNYSIMPTSGPSPLAVTFKPLVSSGDAVFFRDDIANQSITQVEWYSIRTDVTGVVYRAFKVSNTEFTHEFDQPGTYQVKARVWVESDITAASQWHDYVNTQAITVTSAPQLSIDISVFPEPPYRTTTTLSLFAVLLNNYPADRIQSVVWYDPTKTTTDPDGEEGDISSAFNINFARKGTYTVKCKVTDTEGQTAEAQKTLVVYAGSEKKYIKAYIETTPEVRRVNPVITSPRFKYICDGIYINDTEPSGDDYRSSDKPFSFKSNGEWFSVRIKENVAEEYDSEFDAVQQNAITIFDYLAMGCKLKVRHFDSTGKPTVYEFDIWNASPSLSNGNSVHFIVKGNPYVSGTSELKIKNGDILIVDTSFNNPYTNSNQGGIYHVSTAIDYLYPPEVTSKTLKYTKPVLSRSVDKVEFVTESTIPSTTYEDADETTMDYFAGWHWSNWDGDAKVIVRGKGGISLYSHKINDVEVCPQSLTVPLTSGTGQQQDSDGLYTQELSIITKVHKGWNRVVFQIGTNDPSYRRDGDAADAPYYAVYLKNVTDSTGTLHPIVSKKPDGESHTGLDIEATDEDTAYRDALYDTLVAAKAETTLYFAPRNWPEAGQILEVEKVDRFGKPAIAITLPKRVSKYFSGMEGFGYYSLPVNPADEQSEESIIRPRGCIFCTPQKDTASVIRLSAAESIEFTDFDWNVPVKKEGLYNHPVVLFAQNNEKLGFNCFGELNLKQSSKRQNLDFGVVPFQPYITLLRKDEFLQNTAGDYRFYALTYDATRRKDILDYGVSHVHSIKPFDIDYLKFRNKQHKETKYYELNIGHDALFSSEDGYTNWGKGDVLEKTLNTNNLKDMLSWNKEEESERFTWSECGSLLLRATDTPESVDISNPSSDQFIDGITKIDERSYPTDNVGYGVFNGPPDNLGFRGDATRNYRQAILHSMNTVYSNYGKIDDMISASSVYTINDYMLMGKIGSAFVGVNTRLNLKSSKLTSSQTNIIRQINKNNRCVAYVKGSEIYLYDQFLQKDIGPYSFIINDKGNTLANENITNLEPVGKVSFRYCPSETWLVSPVVIQADEPTLLKNFPLASKYFGSSIVEVNADASNIKANWQVLGGRLGGYQPVSGIQNELDSRTIDVGKSKNETEDTILKNSNDKIFSGSVFEDAAFFTSETTMGMTVLGQRSFYYEVDVETGNIIEQFDGSFDIPVEDLSNTVANQSIMVQLNEENSRQMINLKGTYDGLPFNVSSDIVLADLIKPVINNGIDKILVNKSKVTENFDIEFNCSDWIPDRIMLCGTQLNSTPSYANFFTNNAASETDTYLENNSNTFKIRINSSLDNYWKNDDGSYISGAHFITLGLENYPNATRANGYRANYQQNNKQELLDNFSSKIVVVNEDDIAVSVQNDKNNRVLIKVKVNADVFSVDSSKISYNKENDITIISKDLTGLPVVNLGIGNVTPESINRYCGCTLATMSSNGMTLKRYVIQSSSDVNITLSGNVVSELVGKTVAIAPFIPAKAQIYNSRGQYDVLRNLTYDAALEINKTSGSITFNSILYTAEDNIIYVDLIDSPSSFIYTAKKKIALVSSSGSIEIEADPTTYVEFGLYTDYDSTMQLFSSPFNVGAGASFTDFFNLGTYEETVDGNEVPSDIFIKIKFSKPVVINSSKDVTLRLYDGITKEELISAHSPYTTKSSDTRNKIVPIGGNIIQNTVETRADTFKAEINRHDFPDANKEIKFVLTAYDIDGELITFGNI